MSNTSGIFSVLAIIFAIAATVLAYIFIIPEKKRAKLNGIGKLLHDICNFKFMIIEKIFQCLYVFATAFVITQGFFNLFSFDYRGDWIGYYGFLIMILGPIFVRITYELVMLALIAVKNIIQINNKLKNQNEEGSDSTFAMPSFKDYSNAPVAKFCIKCGSPLSPNGSCPNCD